ncbi:MAG TPA: Fur family transcriptional regulator [Acidimicrobiales bacterium]|nr:Fur family transcriptional regulator [Acidimicrobiales bacterium]
MPSEIHGTVEELLARAGQRYTPVRRATVDALSSAARPLTIVEIIAAARAQLAQSSVYRTLAVLEEVGVVHRLTGPPGFARYELDESLTEHHHHLVCTSCGTVEDLPASTRLEKTVALAAAEVAAGSGFTLQGHRLDLVGICASCE